MTMRCFKQFFDEIKEELLYNNEDTTTKYPRKLTEHLLQREQNRQVNIHNKEAYLEIEKINHRQYQSLNDALEKKYHTPFQKEVIKEIAVRELFKKSTVTDIEQLLMEYNQLPLRREVYYD